MGQMIDHGGDVVVVSPPAEEAGHAGGRPVLGAELVESVLASGCIDWLQFQGNESAEFCRSFSRPYIKALHAREDANLADLAGEFESAELLLLDTFDEKAPGGTGKTFDWSLADNLPEAARRKLVLAGGLSPDNIEAAVTTVRPFGVDVCSGVERSPGVKDPEKIETFIQGARNG